MGLTRLSFKIDSDLHKYFQYKKKKQYNISTYNICVICITNWWALSVISAHSLKIKFSFEYISN